MKFDDYFKGDCFEKMLISPYSDDSFNRIKNIEILFGEDEYNTSKIISVNENNTFSHSTTKEKTPNRGRGIGGLIITFENENGYTWCKRLLFHKGIVYDSDCILEKY